MAAKKYYGVRAGRLPGVYDNWNACKNQIDGYSGAVYKSFPTEDEARKYVEGTVSNAGPDSSKDSLDIFVDGSYRQGFYGWAFVAYQNGQVLFSDSGAGNNPEVAAIHNVAGELAATMRAVKWAVQQQCQAIVIHHDYMGISAWATGEWQAKNKFTQAYAAFIVPYRARIRFHKVAGHSGVEGNELADKLAGEALKAALEMQIKV